MRLALIAHVFGHRDGQGRVNYENARAAALEGIETTIVAERCDDQLRQSGPIRIVEIGESSLPSRFLKNLSFAIRSARWISRHRHEFDLIQANGFVTFSRVDIAVAHFVHSAWRKHPHFPFRKPLLSPSNLYQRLFTLFNAWQERKVYRRARRVIAVSKKTAGEVEALGVPPARLSVLYNGVDTDAYHPGTSERRHFQLPEKVPLALFVGDLKTRRKNLELVLLAMQSLPELHLVVAGESQGSEYPRMARDLGVASRVLFLGKISEVPRLMRSVDLFVFPSRYEAHPLVVMEAMAAGLPIIISRSVAGSETFGQFTTVIEDTEYAPELAAAIGFLLASPERMQILGREARAYAEQMSWSHTSQRYLAVYKEVFHPSGS